MTETNPPAPAQILIYRDGALNLKVRLDGQTVWLTQRQIAPPLPERQFQT